MKRAISLILSVMMLVGMFSMIPFASAENKYYVVNDGTANDNVAVRSECADWTTLEQHDGYFTLKSGENHAIYAGVFNRGLFFTLGEEIDMTNMPIFEILYRVDQVQTDKQYHFQVNFCNGNNGDGYNCNNLGFSPSTEWTRWKTNYTSSGNAGLADVDMTKIKKISLSQMNYNGGVSLGTSFDFKGVAIMDQATIDARTAEETRIQALIDALDVTEENIASTAASVKEVKDALKAANESYPNFMVDTAKYDAALPIFTAYYESMNKEFDVQFSAAEDKNCIPGTPGSSSNDNSTYTEGTQSVAINNGNNNNYRFWIFQNGNKALDITDAINADGEFYVTYDLWCGEGNNNWNRLVTCVGTTESINGWKEKASIADKTTKLNVGWNHYAVKFNVNQDFTKNTDLVWDPANFGLIYIWGDGAKRDVNLKIDDVRIMSVRSYEEKFAAKNVAKDVISAIAELGEVTEDNLADVKALKAKYDALNDEQKALVTNSAKLDEAYAKYIDLSTVEFNASFNAAEDKNILPGNADGSFNDNTTYTEGTQSVGLKGSNKTDFRFWIFRNSNDATLDITNAIDKNGDFYVTYDFYCDEGSTKWNRIVTQLGAKDGMNGWKQNLSFVDRTTKFNVGWNHYAIKLNTSMFTEHTEITWDPTQFAFIVIWGDGGSGEIKLKIDDVRIMGTKTYANDYADICAAKDVFTAIVEAGTDPDKVLAAAEAYNALTDKQKGLVANAGDIDAKVEAANIAKAAAVDALIDAIGTVTKNSDDAIAAARAAYDKLNDTQKALVTKYGILTAAEDAYKNLSDYFSENASIVNWRAGYVGTASFKEGVATTYGRGAAADYGDKIGMIAAGVEPGYESNNPTWHVNHNLTDEDTVTGWAVANVIDNVMVHSANLDWSVVAPNVGDKFTLVVKGEARTRSENDILSNTAGVADATYTFDVDGKAVKNYTAAEYDALPVYTEAEYGYTYRRMVLEAERADGMNGQVRVQIHGTGYTSWMVVYGIEAYNAAGEKVWERTAQNIYDGNGVGILGADWGSHWLTDAGVRFNKTGDGTGTDMWGLYAAKQETAGVYALEYSMKMTDVAEGNVISIGRNSPATGVQTWTTITDKQVKGDYAIYTHMFKYDPNEGDGRIEPIIRLYGNADITLTNIRLVKISDVKAVEYLIDSIGEVTLDSKAAIEEARAAYDALSDEDKNLVTNYETLENAEKAYARLQPIFNYAHTADEINEYDSVDNEGNPIKVKDWRQHVAGWTTPEIDEEDYVQGNGSIILEGDNVGNIGTIFRMMNRITNFQADLNDTPYFEMFWKTDVDLSSQIQINFGYNREDGRNWAPGKDFAANRWQRIQVKVTDVAPAVEMGENGMIINSLRICYLKENGFPETITVHMDGLMFFNEAFLTARTAEETRIEALIDALSNDSTDEELLAVKAALDESSANYANFYPANMVKWNRLYNAYLAKQAVADAIAKIDAIGEVALTDECKALIDAADAAFNALTDAQKEDVTNKQTLIDAKAKYADLAAVKAVEDLIDAIGEVTKDSGEAITNAENAYNALTEGQKAMVNPDKVAALAKAREDYDKLAVKYGDINGDGEITATDALLALQASVGKYDLTEDQVKVANVDGEGGVTANDALLILQRTVDKLDKFPVEDKA